MRFDVFIGLNRGSSFTTGPASVSQPEAIATVARLLQAAGIPGATIVPSFGVWEGTLEPGIVVSIFGEPAEPVADFVYRARRELRQDAILVSCGQHHDVIGAGSDEVHALENLAGLARAGG